MTMFRDKSNVSGWSLPGEGLAHRHPHVEVLSPFAHGWGHAHLDLGNMCLPMETATHPFQGPCLLPRSMKSCKVLREKQNLALLESAEQRWRAETMMFKTSQRVLSLPQFPDYSSFLRATFPQSNGTSWQSPNLTSKFLPGNQYCCYVYLLLAHDNHKCLKPWRLTHYLSSWSSPKERTGLLPQFPLLTSAIHPLMP